MDASFEAVIKMTFAPAASENLCFDDILVYICGGILKYRSIHTHKSDCQSILTEILENAFVLLAFEHSEGLYRHSTLGQQLLALVFQQVQMPSGQVQALEKGFPGKQLRRQFGQC